MFDLFEIKKNMFDITLVKLRWSLIELSYTGCTKCRIRMCSIGKVKNIYLMKNASLPAVKWNQRDITHALNPRADV